MNYATSPGQRVQPVELASEPDFEIGALHVSPALRVLRVPDREEVIEPRAMQVLVALARANSAVVSRDALIERCWGGRIVGDDAINSCIAKVRAVAGLTDPPAFAIETIPRVGYQLKAILSPKPAEPTSTASATARAIALARSDRVDPVASRLPWKWIGATTGIASIIGAALAAILLVRPAPASQWMAARLDVPIATSLIERHPAISPDGTMIAYSAGADILSRKIYLHRISGEGALKLTDDSFDDASPGWSPDGSQIAYVAHKDGEPCHIMIIPALSGSSREVARCKTDERTRVIWSFAGNVLYFLDSANPETFDRIMNLDLETGRISQLTHPPAGSYDEHEPAVSPDGHWMTFCRELGNARSARVLLNLRTGVERSFECYEREEPSGLAWSDDSRTVFITSNFNGEHALWAAPIDGGPPGRILSSPQEMERIGSGPRGLLAVEIDSLVNGLARALPVAGDKPAYIESDNANTFTPAVAADGTIAVAQIRPDSTGLWIFPKAGPARKIFTLAADDAQCAEPRWSPDGTRIAISSNRPASTGLRIVSSTGVLLSRILFPGSYVGAAAWSADGSSLIFPGVSYQVWRLWRADLAGHLSALPYTGWVSVQTRGGEMYGVRADRPGVWRIDAATRQITKLPSPDNPAHWTIAGDQIAYAVNPYGARRQFFSQPIGGGAPRLMAEAPGFAANWGMAYDPSSRSIIYVANIRTDSDIELLHLVRK